MSRDTEPYRSRGSSEGDVPHDVLEAMPDFNKRCLKSYRNSSVRDTATCCHTSRVNTTVKFVSLHSFQILETVNVVCLPFLSRTQSSKHQQAGCSGVRTGVRRSRR